jgi:hypothetical protein
VERGLARLHTDNRDRHAPGGTPGGTDRLRRRDGRVRRLRQRAVNGGRKLQRRGEGCRWSVEKCSALAGRSPRSHRETRRARRCRPESRHFRGRPNGRCKAAVTKHPVSARPARRA